MNRHLRVRKGTSKGGSQYQRAGSSALNNFYLALLNVVWIAGLASLFNRRIRRSYVPTMGADTKSNNHPLRLTGSFDNCSTAIVEEKPFHQGFHDGSVTLSCRRFHYKAPADELAALSGSYLIIGVISTSDNSRRWAIRQTWKQLAPFSVFFVLSGDFDKIKEEYELYKDIVWLDKEENDSDLTYKTQLLFHVIHSHTYEFNFLLKTNDDCFVNVTKFEENPEVYSYADYWGHCKPNTTISVTRPSEAHMLGYDPKFELVMEEYSYSLHYCFGAGVLLSNDFVKCAVNEIASIRYFEFDNVATGMLAERCHIEPVDAGHNKIQVSKSKQFSNATVMDFWIQQNFFSIQSMVKRWNNSVV